MSTSRFRGARGLLLLSALALGVGCPRGAPGPAAVDASASDGGATPEKLRGAAPDVLLYSAELALREGDRPSARLLLDLGLKKLNAPLSVEPVLGLRQLPAGDGESEGPVLREIAASGVSVAVAHRRLLSVVELHGGYRVLRLPGQAASVVSLALSANGLRVATLDAGHVAHLYALPTGSPVAEVKLELPDGPEPCAASCLTFSPDSRLLIVADGGTRLAANGAQRRLRVFDTATGAQKSTIAATDPILHYTARGDGSLAVLSRGQAPRFFDAAAGTEWPRREPAMAKSLLARRCLVPGGDPGAARRSWAVSPDRRVLATLEPPTTLCLWDIAERSLRGLFELKGYGDRLELRQLLENGAGILVGQGAAPGPRELLLIHGTSGVLRGKLPPLSPFPLDDGGALLLPSSGAPSLVRVAGRDGPLRAQIHPLRPPVSGAFAGLDLGAVSGNGRHVFFVRGGADGGPALVDLKGLFDGGGGARLQPLPSYADPACCVEADFLGLDQQVLYVDRQANLRVHALPSGELVHASPPLVAVTGLRHAAEQLEIDVAVPGPGPGPSKGPRRLLLWPAAGRISAAEPGGAGMAGHPDGGALPTPAVGPPPKLPPSIVPAAVSAWTATPDGRMVIVGDRDGRLTWIDVPSAAGSGAVKLRMQLVVGDGGAVGAVALAPDGHFELLGSVPEPADFLICRAGSYAAPLPLCQERLAQSDLVQSSLAAGPVAAPAGSHPNPGPHSGPDPSLSPDAGTP